MTLRDNLRRNRGGTNASLTGFYNCGIESSVKSAIRVKQVTSKDELQKAFAIRTKVFVKEQGVSEELELDADDQKAIHLLAWMNNQAAGAARIVIRGKTAKIGRMAVLKRFRNRGIGTRLLTKALAVAEKKNAAEIFLNAQVPVIGFYEKLGFRATGSVFDEAGIPHRKMIFQRKKASGTVKGVRYLLPERPVRCFAQKVPDPLRTPLSNMACRVVGFGTTVFSEINDLAQKYNAVNLGQGAPDFDGAPQVLTAAVQAINTRLNQYAPGIGMLAVRQAVAEHAQRFYQQEVNPETDVLVTAGATEGIFAAILGLTDPGDEVIVFQPVYDSYVPNMIMAGVTPRYVALRGAHWDFDPDELARAFNRRTRAIIVNTPHNPTGKVYSRQELTIIAELCQQNNTIAITDEVYEHIVYDHAIHTRLATLPGMADRTVTVSSLGKTFSVTGWKIGWAIGAEPLVTAVNRAHQFITFAVASPLQAAAATALRLPNEFFENLQATYQTKRDRMLAVLRSAGFKVLTPQGSYFIIVDWRSVAPKHVGDGFQFAQWLTRDIGVACIPAEPFYQEADRHLGKYFARFAVCKKDETLAMAAEKLSRVRTF
jgi:N-succinyldiaminopimelate aminotransferase